MAGFMKKGIVLVLLTMIIFAPVFVSAVTKTNALFQGYHTTLYTSGVDSLDTNNPFVSIIQPKLVIGADATTNTLILERVGSTSYQIYPNIGGKNLILTTRSATQYGGTSGSIYVYPGAEETPGKVVLAHTGTNKRGYVGIGTADPSQQLEVNGNVKITNGYMTSSGNFIIRLS